MTDDDQTRSAQLTAARVAAFADLADVRLFGSDLKVERIPHPASRLTWQLDMEPAVKYEEDSDFFILEVKYAVRIGVLDGEDAEDEDPNSEVDEDGRTATESDLALLNFVMAALYRLAVPEGAPPAALHELDAYAKTMGALTLYPYAREFVQNMTARMGLPPLTLATYRLPYPEAVPDAERAPASRTQAKPRPRSKSSRSSRTTSAAKAT